MEVLLLNGSPRRGNTYTALKSLKSGLYDHKHIKVTQIDATSVSVSPCIACEYCKEHGKCAVNDDTNAIINQIAESDFVVFATPVYWWGISAQLKVIIDKFYSQQKRLASSKKRVGLITVGQLDADNIQYKIISQQIQCIADYLGWEVMFRNAYSAYDVSDLAGNGEALSEIYKLAEKIVL